MKFPGIQEQPGVRQTDQINLKVNVSQRQNNINKNLEQRPYSSSDSNRSNTTQRSIASMSSSKQRLSYSASINRVERCNQNNHGRRKNVLFSREDREAGPEVSDEDNVLNENRNDTNGQVSTKTNAGVPSPRGAVRAKVNRIFQDQNLTQNRPTSRQRRAVSAYSGSRTSNESLSGKYGQRNLESRGRLHSRENSSLSSESKTVRGSSRRIKRQSSKAKRTSNSDDSSDSESNSPLSSVRTTGTSRGSPTPDVLAAFAATCQAQSQAWTQFETHVKLIDDSTDLITRQPRKSFNASDAFQSVMEDMFGNVEYGKSRGFTKLRTRIGNVATYASRFIGKVKALHGNRGEDEDEFDEVDYDDDDYGPSKETVENARRGWRILRQHVQDMAAEKRMSQSALSWDILRHTVRGLTNMEKARYDLYQRYGLVPMIRSDGTVIQENTMLSERARSALANKQRNPVMNRYHSATTSRARTYKSIDGYTGYNRSETP